MQTGAMCDVGSLDCSEGLVAGPQACQGTAPPPRYQTQDS